MKMTNTKKIFMVSLLAALSASGSSFADEPGSSVPIGLDSGSENVSTQSESRIRMLKYDPYDIFIIRTKFGYETNIVFDPKEDIESISLGDKSLWQIIPSGNRLFLRPLTEEVETNMTLLTNKRSYEFLLKSVASKDNNNIYVAKFIYPDPRSMTAPLPPVVNNYVPVESQKIVAMPVQETKVSSLPPVQPSEEAKPAKPENIKAGKSKKSSSRSSKANNNYNYTYSGDDALAPAKMYDDGKSTFITYHSINKQIDLPNVFIVGADGKEVPAVTEIHGSDIKVKSVSKEFVLRNKSGEARVYNEALSAPSSSSEVTNGK